MHETKPYLPAMVLALWAIAQATIGNTPVALWICLLVFTVGIEVGELVNRYRR